MKAPELTPEPQPAVPLENRSDVRPDASGEPPLVVDLDDCLVRTDLLVEAILTLIKRKPLTALCMPLWLLRGRAVLKRELANHVTLEIGLLPWREELCEWLSAEHQRGRRLVLASASDEKFAGQVAAHFGIFEKVVGSDGTTNLKGAAKRDRLVQEFGEKGFDYAGNAKCDLAVWSSARAAIVVSRSRRLQAGAARRTTVDRVIETRSRARLPAVGAMRTHHWLKNVLVFIPLLAAQRLNELDMVGSSVVAFGSFCLLASGLYIFNDLFDLNADRRHPRKKYRPIPAEIGRAHV